MAPASWLRRLGLPLLTSQRKEEPARVVLLCFQAALWRCGSHPYSPPRHGVSRRGCLRGWHHFEHRLLSPTERPRAPPRPLPTRACTPSPDLPVDVAWPWSHGGVISWVLLLSLAITACRPTQAKRHLFKVEQHSAVSGSGLHVPFARGSSACVLPLLWGVGSLAWNVSRQAGPATPPPRLFISL